ncbi:MAG: hypothetical protein JO170_11630, partial [Verrucomicrobia bacterium]|nr:hypothetical protein [Verrucomicrobiota bacterium]
DTTGVRPNDLEQHLNFQKGLTRLAARDAAIFELLSDVRHLLKPLKVLEDPSIADRVKEELTSEPSLSVAAQ